MENIAAQLKKNNMNVKTLIDWDNNEKVEQLTLYLREIQSDLQAKMHQSIETHILGKQKLVNTLNDALPAIHRHRSKEINTDEELNSLIEIMEVREKIDFTLQAIESVTSKAREQQQENM